MPFPSATGVAAGQAARRRMSGTNARIGLLMVASYNSIAV
jgi:hypothetical protein